MNRVLVALVTAATVLISLSTLAHANLIVNNSFEDPVVAVGGARIFAAASTPPLGWSVVGPGSLAIIGGGFTQFGFSFPAQDGVQWLDLTGISSNQPIGIQQVVATVPGTTYDLSFWVGNVVGFFNSAATSTVNLFIGGTLALPATNTGGGRLWTGRSSRRHSPLPAPRRRSPSSTVIRALTKAMGWTTSS